MLDTKDLFENPHLLKRGFVHEIDHPALGRIKILEWAPRLPESEVPIKPVPTFGQHSREVVAEDLALSSNDIDALVAEGVIFRWDLSGLHIRGKIVRADLERLTGMNCSAVAARLSLLGGTVAATTLITGTKGLVIGFLMMNGSTELAIWCSDG